MKNSVTVLTQLFYSIYNSITAQKKCITFKLHVYYITPCFTAIYE